jgi:D-aminoacyl-tRNA deacylase
MTNLLRIINKNTQQARLYHKVCFEVTHHGPYMDAPTIFVEVGSNEEEWKKQEPAKVISKSILELLSTYQDEKEMNNDVPVLIGIGGRHYAPRFTDVALEKNVAFGHMIPTYQIDAGYIDEEILEKTIVATPNVKGVYLHKKELKKSQVTYYKKCFKKKGIPVVSSKDFTDL